MSLSKIYRPAKNPPNPLFDRQDDAQKAKGAYREAGGTLLVNNEGKVTSSSLASWVRAGLPGPRADTQRSSSPTNVDGVTRHNLLGLTIDRSNFHTFLGLPAMPANLEAARIACQIEQTRLNGMSRTDPDLPAKQKALDRAWAAAQKSLKPTAAGGGLVFMSGFGQYWQKLKRSFMGYVREMAEMHYAIIGSNASATNAELKLAYDARKAEIKKEHDDAIQAMRGKLFVKTGANQEHRQKMKELERSWNWIRKRHGI
jgi:hypothetical protein